MASTPPLSVKCTPLCRLITIRNTSIFTLNTSLSTSPFHFFLSSKKERLLPSRTEWFRNFHPNISYVKIRKTFRRSPNTAFWLCINTQVIHKAGVNFGYRLTIAYHVRYHWFHFQFIKNFHNRPNDQSISKSCSFPNDSMCYKYALNWVQSMSVSWYPCFRVPWYVAKAISFNEFNWTIFN